MRQEDERRMTSVFERYLTLWVGLCIVAGILLGKLTPGLAKALDGCEAVVHVDPMEDVQKQREDVLRDRVGSVHGHIRDRDAMLFGRVTVHAIEPRGSHSDELNVGQLLKCLFRDTHFVDHQNVGVLRTLQQVAGGCAIMHFSSCPTLSSSL